MQKVKFEAATGAELRQQMMDFLGLNGSQTISTVVKGTDIVAKLEMKTQAPAEVINPEVQANQEAVQTTETVTKKRRTKAEIEAEKNATTNQVAENEGTIENTKTEVVEETTIVEEKTEVKSEITRAFLTEIVLAKGRDGKKPAMMKVFAEFMQADGATPVSGLPNLDASDYATFYEKIKDL